LAGLRALSLRAEGDIGPGPFAQFEDPLEFNYRPSPNLPPDLSLKSVYKVFASNRDRLRPSGLPNVVLNLDLAFDFGRVQFSKGCDISNPQYFQPVLQVH
jgi:hypothetical protein